MNIGSDIQRIEFIPGNPKKNTAHTIKSKQQIDSTTVEFYEIVVDHDVLGREIGAKKSRSTYVFLLGSPLNSPVNLIIIRHRQKK